MTLPRNFPLETRFIPGVYTLYTGLIPRYKGFDLYSLRAAAFAILTLRGSIMHLIVMSLLAPHPPVLQAVIHRKIQLAELALATIL
jgi:hypothetical protein